MSVVALVTFMAIAVFGFIAAHTAYKAMSNHVHYQIFGTP